MKKTVNVNKLSAVNVTVGDRWRALAKAFGQSVWQKPSLTFWSETKQKIFVDGRDAIQPAVAEKKYARNIRNLHIIENFAILAIQVLAGGRMGLC